MVRKLQVYQTSQGFYDLLVAAPSMKAALEAWGAGSNLFQQGDARLSEDQRAISAALKKPGTVLRRPIGTDKAFAEQSGAPTVASLEARMPKAVASAPRSKPSIELKSKTGSMAIDANAERKTVLKYEKDQARQKREREAADKAEAIAVRRRQVAVDEAQLAMTQAERQHSETIELIEQERASVERRADAENRRWEIARKRLNEAIAKARQ